MDVDKTRMIDYKQRNAKKVPQSCYCMYMIFLYEHMFQLVVSRVSPSNFRKCVVWDAACVDSFYKANVKAAFARACGAANYAKDEKLAKYDFLADSHIFLPLDFETSGALHQEICSRTFFEAASDFVRGKMYGTPLATN